MRRVLPPEVSIPSRMLCCRGRRVTKRFLARAWSPRIDRSAALSNRSESVPLRKQLEITPCTRFVVGISQKVVDQTEGVGTTASLNQFIRKQRHISSVLWRLTFRFRRRSNVRLVWRHNGFARLAEATRRLITAQQRLCVAQKIRELEFTRDPKPFSPRKKHEQNDDRDGYSEEPQENRHFFLLLP
jgi:hypothetical protein